jgi:hypothetical protein
LLPPVCCWQVVDLVQTLDGGRRNMYDPDEIEEEQREREKRNKINADFNQFVRRVQVRLQLQSLDKIEIYARNVVRVHRVQSVAGLLSCRDRHCMQLCCSR